jgi:hypothetical protein
VRLLFRHIRKKWIRHGDVRSALPHTGGMRRSLRFAGMKMVEAGGLAPPQPVGASRLQRGAIAAVRLVAQGAPTRLTLRYASGCAIFALPRFVCHASKNGGSGGNRTRGLLLMRELR